VLELLLNLRVLLLALVLVACGSDEPESEEEAQDDAASPAPDAGSSSDASSQQDAAAEEGIAASKADASAADAATDATTDAAAVDAASADAARADAAADANAPVVDAGPSVRYSDVQPIFFEYCVSCHSPDGKGPFSLDNYDEAADYADQAYAAANARIMPPCAVNDPSCGPTTSELATLLAWVLQGAKQ
jgi:hypothetical protein